MEVHKNMSENQPVEIVSDNNIKDIDRFPLRFAQLGALVREESKNLKFDSTVDNINYDYVDTQQYKELIGRCCDKVGIGVVYNTKNEDLQIQFDQKGTMIFIAKLNVEITFFDPFLDFADKSNQFVVNAFGMGVSRGSGYAVGIAQTNAIRNLLTNQFMIPTSDRESDDVREGIQPIAYLTDSAKNAKREELLERTKSTSQFATVQYGTIVYARIQETLKKDIDPAFRETLERFVDNKFINGKPIPQPEDDSLWIVKKSAANKILSDLDAV